MNLIIVESPTKARTLSRFLGKDYQVDPTMGHVMDLPKSKLGVDVEHDFEPDYVPVVKRQDIISKIKSDSKKAKRIYLATDPDREGEAISYHVKSMICQNPKIERIVFHEITENAVKAALEHPREVDLRLVDAQQARRVLDRLVGYKLSPLLWKKVRIGLSAGRVQSVTVRLVVEKEREIEAFRSEEYWEIFVLVNSKQKEEKSFLTKLIEKNGQRIKVTTGEVAQVVVADLENSDYTVESVERREVVKHPPAPFTTSTMTQSAGRSLFWSAKKTMNVAQKLYEEGLITYHRTDSTNLSIEAINIVRSFIKKEYGEKFLPSSLRMYKVKSKLAQEAHEAIRPTNATVLRVPGGEAEMGVDAVKLYGLIWRRFVACQMADSLYDETAINVKACQENKTEYLLQAKGQVMKFEGWKAPYGEIRSTRQRRGSLASLRSGPQAAKFEAQNEEAILPDVFEGEKLDLDKVISEQKFTEPPVRYTEATLIKTLEKLGIGRPSTYAPTLSTIQDRQYVEKEEGKFIPTSLGIAVNDFLVEHFKDVVDYGFTAEMENHLDEIAHGEKEWVPIIASFWKSFFPKIEEADKKAERVKVAVESTGKKCPKCGDGDQVIRVGRFGKFLSCSRFPECDWSAPYVETLNMKCPDCQKGDVVVKKTKRGKHFYGCSKYPKCKWASWRKPGGDINKR